MSVDGDEVVVNTAYGEKRLAKADVLLNKCLMCKGAAYKIADEELAEPLPVPQFTGDKFAKVKEIEAMSPRSASPSGKASCPSASAAMPAVISARRAAVSNAFLISPILR